ncbi:MAG: NAD/NADP octopine/nopaline dehydrogenase family protein [Bacillota bacterium]
MKTMKSITVCGGGNAAHVVVPLLAVHGYRVTLYVPLDNEATQFQKGAAEGGLEAHFPDGRVVRGSPALITRDPREAADADLILMVVPAFAHGPLLRQLAPHLPQKAVVGAIPARSGFELEALYSLRDKVPEYTVFCGHTLPWACRIEQFGRLVRVLGIKQTVGIAAVPAKSAPALAGLLGTALDVNFAPMANSLAVSLGNIGQVIHPGIMYGLLKNYSGTIWSEADIPLFYQGVTEEAAAVLNNLSNEIVTTASRLSLECGVDLSEVITVGQWLIRSYARYIADSSSLCRAFRTNSSYRGLKMPVIEEKGGYVPDFRSRYLTEDIPYGLLFSRAAAAMAGNPTPCMDEVIGVASRWMNKAYLDSEGMLVGPDLKETRIPQNYGINTAAELVKTSLKGFL